MIHFLLLLLTTLGCGLLCLSRGRHQSDLIGRKLAVGTANYLRWSGLLSLVLAFLLSGDHVGWAVGTLEWLGAASLGAVLTMTALTLCSTRRSAR